ncbi:MAG: hypothetical protein ABEJ40_00715 [Haloarculaceae archaeon]
MTASTAADRPSDAEGPTELGGSGPGRASESVGELEPTTLDDDPTVVSAALSIAVAMGTMLVIGDGVLPGLAVAAVGLAVVAGGREVRGRGHRHTGRGVVAVGGICLLAAVWVTLGGATPGQLVRLLPGAVGVVALGWGLVSGSDHVRGLLVAGAAGVLLSVFVTGTFRAVGFGSLAVATAGTVVAWDLGARATELGAQLGRGAETRRVELVAAGTTAAVAALAVLVAHVVRGLSTSALSRESLVVSFLALVLLLAALRR